jgi:hypothetical protein
MYRRAAAWMSCRIVTGVALCAMALALIPSTSALAAAGRVEHARGPTLAFVLEPTWLPAGFSASGGDSVEPTGGLNVGGRQDSSSHRTLFTESYFGYRNPEDKSLRLSAFRFTGPRLGGTRRLAGRRVVLTSSSQAGPYGATTDTSAIWTERGVLVIAVAQGVTDAQMAHFVAGLREHAAPR